MESMFIVFGIVLLVTCVQKTDSAIDDFMYKAEERIKNSKPKYSALSFPDNNEDESDKGVSYDMFYHKVNGKKEKFVKVQYDMLLPKRQYNKLIGKHRSRRNAINDENMLWPNGRIPYTIDNKFKKKQKNRIKRAIALWNKWTCLTIFEAVDKEYSKVKFIQKKTGCGESFVGMVQGKQFIKLSNKCANKVNVVVHEIGHAIGLYHEHMRHDRDKYIVVHNSSIEKAAWYNFEVLGQNQYKNYSKPYDYLSIMHYGKTFFSRNKTAKLVTMSPKNESYLDIIGEVKTISYYDAKIVCQLYNCAANCNLTCSGTAFMGKNCQCLCRGPSDDKPISYCLIGELCSMPTVDYSKYVVLGKNDLKPIPKNSGPFNIGTMFEIEWIDKNTCGDDYTTYQCQNGTWTGELPKCKPCGLSKTDLVIIIDASTSVTEVNFQKMRDFVKEFLSNADINSGSVRIGINIYSTDVQIQFLLDDYTTEAEIMDAVDNIPYIYGSTNTADSLKVMREQMFTMAGDRPDAPNVAMILTDGFSNINSRRTIKDAEQARADGIHIYAIGIGLKDTREVDGIASVPASSNRFNVQTFDELRGLSQKIFSTGLCPDPTESPPVIDLPRPCWFSPRIDILFLLDSSASVTYQNFQKVLKFTKDILNGADIGNGNVRVAMIVFGTDMRTVFGLDTYQTKAEVFDAIDKAPFMNSRRNTHQVLYEMRRNVFRPKKFDRNDVEKVAILVTGGLSDIKLSLTLPEARRSHRKKIQIYTVGIGLHDTTEVFGIATPPVSESTFLLDNYDELKLIPQRMFRSLCVTDFPPTANAGYDQTILLPDDRIVLSGRWSTDDVGIVKYEWYQSGGPNADVRELDSPDIELYNLEPGTYTIQIKVTDALGQTDTDDVVITVD